MTAAQSEAQSALSQEDKCRARIKGAVKDYSTISKSKAVERYRL